jgi:nanoRNase/pAp phosphatase (c-di-AMP/oligoRNAs hydrolase)
MSKQTAGNNSTAAPTPAQELLRFLRERGQALSPLLILTHDYPDPDALAAAFALQYLAEEEFGIESRIAFGGVVGRMENKAMVRLLRMPVHPLRTTWLKRFANVALVDTQPAFENNSFPAGRKAAIVIDQHPSATKPNADLALVDPQCGATCVIISQALLLLGKPLPERVATALAYGILTDTLDLYRAERPDVVQTYLQVLHYCDMRTLAKIQNPVRSRNFFETLRNGIQNATLQRSLMVSHLGQVENPDLIAQVAEFLLAYRRTSWCLATGRFHGKLHASLRSSTPDVEAGDILRAAFQNPRQAGGHGQIAGGSCRVGGAATEETWREKEAALQARLAKRLRIPARAPLRQPFRSEPLKRA